MNIDEMERQKTDLARRKDEMPEKSILFDTESVRGLLTCAQRGTMSVPFPCEKCGSTEFTKTQTRRVAKRLRMHEDFGKPVWDEAWIDPRYAAYGSC